jgi:hypothetical protein
MAIGYKTGGREAGTPNKASGQLRAQLKLVLGEQLANIPTLLEALPIDKRLEMIIKLMPYCMPKVDAIAGNYDSSIMDEW